MLNEFSPVASQELFPLICGIGIGMLFHAPYQVLTKSIGSANLASATSAFFLVRFTGATTGLVRSLGIHAQEFTHMVIHSPEWTRP